MNHTARLLLLIPHLGGGGAEQVTSLLAKHLSREDFDLHLGLVTQTKASSAPSLPGVTVHALGASRVRAGAFRLLQLVRWLKPDLILSSMAHLNFLILALKPLFPSGTHVIVRQNATASASIAFGGLPGSTRLLYRLLYPRADLVICQSQAMARDLASNFEVSDDRTPSGKAILFNACLPVVDLRYE